ncbi:PREDICTED: uncharacterized protein LOC108563394, partial [Nicrophorus vespilloides]|uniref:Uncharacterized protein LOC108563394 n=1 Tax=Nicrophorus vespilloides TaxID=110193 RepID=A0ABM1MSJ3_NICVS
MRSVLLVFALAFTLISGQFDNWHVIRTDIYTLSQYCVNSTNIDNELVVKSMQGEFVNDPKFLDYTSCIATELDLMDEDGEFEEDNFLKLMLEILKTKMNKCIVYAKKETSSEKRSFEDWYGDLLYLIFTADLPITQLVTLATYADDRAILVYNANRRYMLPGDPEQQ